MLVEQENAAPARREPESAARLREVEPLVRAICRARLGEADGDDAAQRALLTIWRKLESERGVDCLPTYAATCARYETLSAYRQFQRSATPAGDLSEEVWADAGPGPAEQAERADEVAHARERVEALLTQLSPRQAEVMRASVLADRSTADAATELGITPTGVRAAQVRAMARMRELSGTRSPNPQALNLTSSERGKRSWEAEKARVAARRAADDGVADPLARAREAVEALDGPRSESTDGLDPLDRARTAAAALPTCDALIDSTALERRSENATDGAIDHAEPATDQAGAA